MGVPPCADTRQMPFETSGVKKIVSGSSQLADPFLVAPSSTDERIAMTLENCRGFVYATALMGVTGARTSVSSQAPELVARIRAADPAMPVGVGLGVGNGDQAAEVAAFADGVIVGSALIRCVLEAPDRAAGLTHLRSLDLSHHCLPKRLKGRCPLPPYPLNLRGHLRPQCL